MAKNEKEQLNSEDKKKLKKSMANLIAITITLVFVVVAYSASSVAWLKNNTTAKAQGFSISAYNSSGEAVDAKVYPVKAIADNAYTFVNDTLEEVPPYDTASIEYHKYLTAIVVALEYTVSQTGSYNIVLEGDENAFNSVFAKNNYFSNIAKIKQAMVTGEYSQSFTGDLIATVASGDWSTMTYMSSDQITQNAGGSVTFNMNTESVGTIVTFFVIEYNVPVVDAIGDYFLGERNDFGGNKYSGENVEKVIYQGDLAFFIGQ